MIAAFPPCPNCGRPLEVQSMDIVLDAGPETISLGYCPCLAATTPK